MTKEAELNVAPPEPQTREPDDLTAAYMVGFERGKDAERAAREAAERERDEARSSHHRTEESYERLMHGRSVADADALADVLGYLTGNVRKRVITPEGPAFMTMMRDEQQGIVDNAIASLRTAWERTEAAERRLAEVEERAREALSGADFAAAVKWHTRQAESAMGSLHSGSENWEYREAGRINDLHRLAVAAISALATLRAKPEAQAIAPKPKVEERV